MSLRGPRAALVLALAALLVAGIAGGLIVPRVLLRARIARLASESLEEREEAMRALLRDPSPEAIAPLVRAVSDDPISHIEWRIAAHFSSSDHPSLDRFRDLDVSSLEPSSAAEREREIRRLASEPAKWDASESFGARTRAMDIVRWCATRLALPDAALVDLVRLLLDDESPEVRAHAALIARDLSPSARSALLPALLDCLSSEDVALQGVAALALGTIGVPESMLGELVSLLVDLPFAHPERKRAGDWMLLSGFGLEKTRALDEFAARLADPDPRRAERARDLALLVDQEGERRWPLALAITARTLDAPLPDDIRARFERFEGLHAEETVNLARAIEQLDSGLARETLCLALRENLAEGEPALAATPHLVSALPRLLNAERVDVAICLGPRFWWLDARAGELAPAVREAVLELEEVSGFDEYESRFRISQVVRSLGTHAVPLYRPLLERALARGDRDFTPATGRPRLSRHEELRVLRELVDSPASDDAKSWARDRASELELAALATRPESGDEALDSVLAVLEEDFSVFAHGDLRAFLGQAGDLLPPARYNSLDAAIRLPIAEALAGIRQGEGLPSPGTPSSRELAETLRTLGTLGPRGARYTPALVELLLASDPGSDLRHETARALAGVGAGSPSTAAHLARLLDERADRLVALEALRELGPSARAVSLRVAGALDDLEYRVRYEATRLLGELAPEDERVVDVLTARLGDLHASVRAAAALALGDIGREASALIGEGARLALARARDEDIDERVRAECARAIERLERARR